MQIRCPNCQTQLKVAAQANPSRVRCPSCQTILQVPAAGQVADSSASTGTREPSSTDNDPFGNLPPIPQGAPQTSFPSTTPASTPASPMSAPTTASRSARPASAAGKKGFPIWGYFAIAAAVLLTAPIVCCGVIGFYAQSRMQGTPVVVMTEGLQSVAVPTSFPELGPQVQEFPSGVTMYRTTIRDSPNEPGSPMQLRIYLPDGEHDAQSLPCVLVAPAGTPLLHGANVDGGDYHDETLPYAEAGMVVVHYSIDGPVPDSVDQNDDQAYSNALAKAWPEFKASGGGIVNGRNALEFALARLPAVDPNRICAAGHSSAATLALRLAASEPRIKYCVAYAPAYDCEKRMADAISDPITKMLLPGVKPFVEWYSPMNNVADIRCNLMVFHARDDDNVPFEDANRFVSALSGGQRAVHFVKADSGGHYMSMVQEGIPAAIDWLTAE